MLTRIKTYLKQVEVINRMLRYRDYIKKGRDHKGYIGGKWDTIGELQFNFLVDNGLNPNHVLLDVACGSLRGGRKFIQYLEPGNYMGIDHNRWLIKEGLTKELPAGVEAKKKPIFVISSKFEFHYFPKKPDFALAISLFTHLMRNDIILCLKNLREIMKPGGKYFVSFNDISNNPQYDNPGTSGDAMHFEYTVEEMISFGNQTGWKSVYIGDWNHPRNQKMMKYYLESDK